MKQKYSVLADQRRRPELPHPSQPTVPFGNPLAGMSTTSFPMPYIPDITVEVRLEPNVERLYVEGRAIRRHLPVLRGGEEAQSE